MVVDIRHDASHQLQEVNPLLRPERSLQILLWVLWSLAVVGSAFLMWQSSLAAGGAVDMLRIMLRSALVGMLGLVVMTKIEMVAEPWRFLD